MSARLQEALGLHRAGRVDDAERIYREIVAAEPGNADAWQFLGLIALARNEPRTALDLIRRAVVLQPTTGVYHFNLAIALKRSGDLAASIGAGRRATELAPELAEAHLNLANALRDVGDRAAALPSYRRAVELNPALAEAQMNFSSALMEAGAFVEAETAARRAVASAPGSVLAQCQLGNALKALGRADEAAAAYREALRIDPSYFAPRRYLADLLVDARKFDEALGAYDLLLKSAPDEFSVHAARINALLLAGRFAEATAAGEQLPQPRDARQKQAIAEAYVSLGRTLQGRARRPVEAAGWFQRVLDVMPDYPAANHNLGLALQNQGRLHDAIARYRQELELAPGRSETRRNLALLYQMLGLPADAVAVYRAGLAVRPDNIDLQRFLTATAYYDTAWTQEDRFAEARRLDAMVVRDPKSRAPYAGDSERRLRIGYVTSDFFDHPVARNMEPLLFNRDRGGFEVFVYAEVDQPDDMTGALRAAVDGWRETVGLTDAEVADQIRADRIDILVFLAGHFDRNRLALCAQRAAPLQVSFHDPATSGLSDMDYLIADPVLAPRGGNELFTERVVRLPSFYTHAPLSDAPPVGELPARRNGYVTFGCFNNPAKLGGVVLAIWAQILAAVPNSRLLLKFRRWFASPDLQARIATVLQAFGVDPERVIYAAGDDSAASHLALYRDVDIALDPFPFTGSTTTFEALWMGAPVVTLAGETMVGRWSASILSTLKLRDLIARTPQGYVDTASDLARDVDRLAALRAGLRERVAASSICGGPLRAHQLERLYRALWRRRCAQAS